MLEGARGIPAAHAEPAAALEALVDLHVDFAVARRALLGVWTREQRALSDDVRRSLRRRLRAYEQPWREVPAPLGGAPGPAEITFAVTATLRMPTTAPIVDADIPAERRTKLLRRMALSALLARRPPRR